MPMSALLLLLAGGAATATAPPTGLSAAQLVAWEQVASGAVGKARVEIVVAACLDGLEWLAPEYRPLATVHDQCALPAAANVGRESHVYLQHIVENWDRLAEWTVFTQGHEPSPGYEDNTHFGRDTKGGHIVRGALFDDYVLAWASPLSLFATASSAVRIDDPSNYRHSIRSSFVDAGHAGPKAPRGTWGVDACPPPADAAVAGFADAWHGWVDLKVGDPLEVGEGAFERLHGAIERYAAAVGAPPPSAKTYFTELVAGPVQLRRPDVLLFSQGARFAVRAEAIRAKPREFYQVLLDEVSSDNDPVFGYYNEWMWPWIVADGLDCDTLALDVTPPPEQVSRLLASTSYSSNKNEGGTVVELGYIGIVVLISCCGFALKIRSGSAQVEPGPEAGVEMTGQPEGPAGVVVANVVDQPPPVYIGEVLDMSELG